MTPQRITEIQQAVTDEGCDAWLFCDFRGSDPIGRSILGLEHGLATRRWFYLIPAYGEPRGLVSAVEPYVLDGLPGEVLLYRRWQELHEGLRRILSSYRRVAMQYSPQNAVPYVARVDAGTIELVRGFAIEVTSSADLVQRCEAVWTPEQAASHARAAAGVYDAVHAAFSEIRRALRSQEMCTEVTLQQLILNLFNSRGLVTNHAPIVAANQHSADPHFEVDRGAPAPIREGDFVLIDLWAKEPDGVYADITWTAYAGACVPAEYCDIFEIVRRARDAGVERIRRHPEGLRGCDVDAVVREVITNAGYGDYFVHRTGHSIGREVHGNGANIDGFETPDTRRLLPGTCFSIEPGIYLPGRFGVRSELNVYLDGSKVTVTGGPVQTAVIPILA